MTAEKVKANLLELIRRTSTILPPERSRSDSEAGYETSIPT